MYFEVGTEELIFSDFSAIVQGGEKNTIVPNNTPLDQKKFTIEGIEAKNYYKNILWNSRASKNIPME